MKPRKCYPVAESRFDLTKLKFLTRSECEAELTTAYEALMRVALLGHGKGRDLTVRAAKLAREVENLKPLINGG